MKIAVMADIHGNTFALQAVLRDIERRGIDTVLNVGDILDGPLDPKGTFELLMKHNVVSLAGNGERLVLEGLDGEPASASFANVIEQADDAMLDWLKNLPFHIVWEDKVYGCHGSPDSDVTYLLEELHPGFVGMRKNDELDEMLKDVKQSVVVCGHSHVNHVVQTENKLIVNPGSVGLPAYDDDQPVFHVMECYTPHARYAVLEFRDEAAPIVEQVMVPYEIEKAAKMAERNHRPDWALSLRTGRVASSFR